MPIITVTNNADNGIGSLRHAIYTAQSGDIIQFDSSLANQTITLDSHIGIGKSLTIDGGDAPNLTVSGGGTTNLLRLAQENESLTVRNLTLADSYYEATTGGAIWAAENSTVNIENVNFNNNISDGAALHGQVGSVITVVDSTFDNNDGATISDKSYSAGAISLFGLGSLTVKNSTFTNNKSFSGGAIRVTSSDLIIEDSVFTGNDSTFGADKDFMDVPGGGGAIYLDAASVPNDPRFYGSLSGHDLEGETEGGIFSVKNSRFEDNRAAGGGGAIMAWGYSQDRIIIQDSEIINNEVIKNETGSAEGGGVWLMGFGEIDNTTIADNKSADLGGGLYVYGEVSTKISNSNFSGNKARKGGAFYDRLWDAQVDVNQTTFDSNSAVDEAGIFYSQNDRPVSFQDSQFANNTPRNSANVGFDNNLPDISYGSNSDDVISGTEQDTYLVGLNGNDTLYGNGGDDYLNGGTNNDNLYGGIGNDTLIGAGQENSLFGGNGNDVFIGGNGQDLIEGGDGRDRYIIGDEDRVYYTEHKWYDHAIIKDFEIEQDTIQLRGQASDYTIRSVYDDTGVFYEDNMIALIENISPNQFDLNANYINYTTDFQPPADSSTLEYTLELKQDSLFSGTPDYDPSSHDGLIIWNSDDTWYIETTGDADGSRFQGQIITDGPIEYLSGYQLEDNDRLMFADDSQQIAEFDLRSWEKWTDGISFRVPEETSIFLDLENDSNISIKAGSELNDIQ